MRFKKLLTACLVTSSVAVTFFLPQFQQIAQAQPIECVALEGSTDNSLLTQASSTDAYRDVHRLATGAGVRVAVIDTGVANHPRLDDVEDGGSFVDDAFDAYFDCDAHGTIVASVIAARDIGDGLAGVAPDATIVSLRQTTTIGQNNQPQEAPTGGSLQSLIDAIHAAIDKNVDVINVSVVSCIAPDSPPVDINGLNAALARAEERNIVVVSAAGNASNNCPQGSTTYPSHHPTVIGVAANINAETLAEYSVRSPFPQISAAGFVATALSPAGDGLASGTISNDDVRNFEGTSFAAPFVSGTVALLKQRMPNASAQDIRDILYSSVDPTTGSLDPVRAVSVAAPPSTQPHPLALETPRPKTSAAPRNSALMLAGVIVIALAVLIGLGARGRTSNRTDDR